MKSFPYGRAPFWLLVIAIGTGLFVLALDSGQKQNADITVQIYYKPAVAPYSEALKEIEDKYDITVNINVVSVQAQPQKVNTAFLADAAVPDIIEMESKALGVFTKGPIDDIGFVDLKELFVRDSLLHQFPQRRLKSLSVGERVFAIPHDVHPTLWMYRKDVLDSMGISMDTVDTWPKFLALGQRITRDTDGDGVNDRFMVDMPDYGDEWLRMLLMQMGGHYFNAQGALQLTSKKNADAIELYTKMIAGPTRISFSAGWGQPFARAFSDQKILFSFAPDWRAFMTKLDIPSLAGKMALAQLPRFEGFGEITSTMGGTGLFMTLKGKETTVNTKLGPVSKKELCWEIMKKLYLDEELTRRFYRSGRTIAAYMPSWNMKEVDDIDSYFSNQPVGRMYADIAEDVPFYYNNAYAASALGASSGVMIRAKIFYEQYGENGKGSLTLRQYIEEQLGIEQQKLSRIIERNAFYGKR